MVGSTTQSLVTNFIKIGHGVFELQVVLYVFVARHQTLLKCKCQVETYAYSWKPAQVLVLFPVMHRYETRVTAILITSPAGAVAKYCVCQSVCLSPRTCPEPHARSSTIFLCMLPMAVARSCSGRVTKSQGKGEVLEFSSPLAMHCKEFAVNNVKQQQNGPFRRCQRG